MAWKSSLQGETMTLQEARKWKTSNWEPLAELRVLMVFQMGWRISDPFKGFKGKYGFLEPVPWLIISFLPPATQRCSSFISLMDQVHRALLSSCPMLLLTTHYFTRGGWNNRRHELRRGKETTATKIAAQLMNAARINYVWRKERWIINFGGCRDGGILLMKINPYLYKKGVYNFVLV